MSEPTNLPASVAAALGSGRGRDIVAAAASLGAGDREALERLLGRPAVSYMERRARGRRGERLGRVVVTHGILGGELASVAGSGERDVIWANILRLAFGRLGELALAPDGTSAHEIAVTGIRVEYMPLIVELETRWDVHVFCYDWRLSVDQSAARLDAAIADWGDGEPTHILAHSMGGLVARRFVQRFAARWRALDDTPSHARGGRLVMLGTPNQGSFAIPLMLTGVDRMVKLLALLDIKHDHGDLLEIINTFPGAYQMLPSPRFDPGDDRARLAVRETWGKAPVTQALLDEGLRLQRELADAVDPARMIYVAGYDQPTPYRIRIDADGAFSYQQTRDGDGRVPHELGLLPGVPTFYVAESHGNLIGNREVLAGIHDLLCSGENAALAATKPTTRKPARGEASWQRGRALAPIHVRERETLETVAAASRRSRSPRLSPAALAAAEHTLFSDPRGLPRATVPRGRGKASATGRREGAPPPTLKVEIHCADIREVAADVLAAGHYIGVEPQNAELALDYAVSGREPGEDTQAQPLALTELTRRGVIGGELGDIHLYPLAGSKRFAAIAGMGSVGHFGHRELERLAASLASAVGALPEVRSLGTVLIGSGEGGLTIATAVEAWLDGLAGALGARRIPSRLTTLKLIERHYGKALAIHDALLAYRRARAKAETRRLALRIGRRPVIGAGATIGREYALALGVSGLGIALGARATSRRHKAAKAVLGALDVPATFRAPLEAELGRLAESRGSGSASSRRGAGKPNVLALAAKLGLRLEHEAVANPEHPTRFAITWQTPNLVISALTDTAVIPARALGLGAGSLDTLTERATDPAAADLPELALLMNRLLVPHDFRAALAAASGPVVFELDRAMAKLNWELIAQNGDTLGEAGALAGDETRPLGLERPVARQLRTAYSAAPSPDGRAGGALRALVVGDPGDVQAGDALPGARREALAVADVLASHGVEVTLMVGAPGSRVARFAGAPVPHAALLDVVWQLVRGRYDVLHYCGHGDFDPRDPARSGWLFADGLLGARDLESVDLAPRLIVANACLSGRTSEKRRSHARGRLDADLLPGLTDEFFRRGVRNYVGTAWEIDDGGAIEFATTLYVKLLGEGGTLGDAMLAARRKLHADRADYGALWAAYQHYGTPAFRLAFD